MKIKRAKIAQDFADRIEEIYSRPAPEPAPAGAAERIREKLANAHLPGRGEG
jgi:long-chain acyl-CoA synthetase